MWVIWAWSEKSGQSVSGPILANRSTTEQQKTTLWIGQSRQSNHLGKSPALGGIAGGILPAEFEVFDEIQIVKSSCYVSPPLPNSHCRWSGEVSSV